MLNRKTLYALLAVFVVLLFLEWPSSWLFDPDEARYAEIPQHMLLTGDYLTPQLNGSNYFEKPPLLYWLNALSMKTLGPTPYATRLPVRLATLGMAVLLLLALRNGTSPSNLWASLVFLSSLLPFVLGRINITDSLVSFGLTLSFLSMREALLLKRLRPSLARLGVWLGVAIAVMSKGLIGLLFPMLVLIVWTGLQRQWRQAFQMVFSKEAFLCLTAVVPWFWMMENTHPGFLKIFFVQEHFQRYLTNEANRPGPVFYFVPVLLLGLLPWSVFFLSAIKDLIAFRSSKPQQTPDQLFFGLWFFTIFLFFTFSHSKLIPYLFPAFPAAATLIGLLLASRSDSQLRILKRTMVAWCTLAAVILIVGFKSGFIARYKIGLPVILLIAAPMIGNAVAIWQSSRGRRDSASWLSMGWAASCFILISLVPKIVDDYSTHTLALKASAIQSDQVVAYRTFPHSFPFVFKKPIPVVAAQGELATDGIMKSELFWPEERFWPIWNSVRRVVVILNKKNRDQFNDQLQKAIVLAENRKYILAANFDPAE